MRERPRALHKGRWRAWPYTFSHTFSHLLTPSHEGRWRAWPYTAERDARADDAFWRALCTEWDEAHAADDARAAVRGFLF